MSGQMKSFRHATRGLASIAVTIVATIAGGLFLAPAFAQSVTADEEVVGSAENRGGATSLHLSDMATVVWRLHSNGDDVGPAIVAGEKVFVGIAGGLAGGATVYALDANTGETLWSQALDGRYIAGIAALGDEKRAIAVTTDTSAAALDATTGKLLWQVPVAGGLAGPVAWKDRIYAAGNDGAARAFDAASGELVWSSDFLNDAPPDPEGFDGKRARAGDQPARPRDASCDGRAVFFSVFDQCRTIALNRESGERLWAFRTSGWMFGRPTVTSSAVFVGSQDDWLYCIDKDMGSEAWRFQTGARIEAACAVHEGKVYCGSCDGNLYCLEEGSGKLVWKTSIEKGGRFHGAIYEQPLIGREAIYLPVLDGQLYAFDPATGAIRWKLTPSPDSEIDSSFTDGRRIYLGLRKSSKENGENALVAIGQPKR